MSEPVNKTTNLADYNAGRLAGRGDAQPEIDRLRDEVKRLTAELAERDMRIASAMEALQHG